MPVGVIFQELAGLLLCTESTHTHFIYFCLLSPGSHPISLPTELLISIVNSNLDAFNMALQSCCGATITTVSSTPPPPPPPAAPAGASLGLIIGLSIGSASGILLAGIGICVGCSMRCVIFFKFLIILIFG